MSIQNRIANSLKPFKADSRKTFFTLCFTAGVAIVLSGCSKVSKMVGDSTNSTPSAVVVMLFDLSGSTSSPVIRDRYKKGFDTILSQMKGGEILRGDAITENSMATSSFPINATFPTYNPFTGNPLTQKKALEKASGDAKQQMNDLLANSPKHSHTDLMNAFQLAEKIFNGEHADGAKIKDLVVFSDMVEQTPTYNFANLKLNDKSIKTLIAQLKKSGQLPNLKDVKVWVAGAAANGSGGLPPQRILAIQNFWIQYFAACGANLTQERYASTLLNFDLPSGG